MRTIIWSALLEWKLQLCEETVSPVVNLPHRMFARSPTHKDEVPVRFLDGPFPSCPFPARSFELINFSGILFYFI